MTVEGPLIRVEPNGFGVVRLDWHNGAIGVFTGSDRAAASTPSSFRPNARITAVAEEQYVNVKYLSNVPVNS